jgi:hypothetical protein
MSATGLRPPGWDLATAAPQRVVPILGLRALRYEAEGRPGLMPPLAGLKVVATGVVGARPHFDPLSGQTLFEELPPGPRRLLLVDPERRVLPAAVEVVVPPRHPQRPTLGARGTEAEPPRLTVLLRPAPGRAIPADMTAVIGQVRDAGGRGVPLARIDLATVVEGRATRYVTFSAADGSFVLLLPGEDRAAAPPLREILVHLPAPHLAAALAADFLGALPAQPDAPLRPESPFLPARAQLLSADGTPAAAPAGQLPLRPGRTIRWDILAKPH